MSLATTYRDAFRGLNRPTHLLSLVIFINRCGTMAIPFMSIYVTERLHRSLADAGLIITLFGIGAIVGSLFGGYLTGKFGFRMVQIMTAALSGLLFIGFGLVHNFWVLCALCTGASLFAEAFRPANYAAIATYAAEGTITRANALNRLATNIGFGIGSSLGGILAAFNYQWLFWGEGASYLLGSALIIVLLPRVTPAAITPVPAAGSPLKTASSIKQPSIFGDTVFIRFLLLATVYTTCFFLLFRLVPVYWQQDWHLGESTIGVLMGLNGVVVASFELVLVRYFEKHKPNVAACIAAGVTLTAIGYLLLILPGSFPLISGASCVLLITAGEMLAMPFIGSFVLQRAKEHSVGKYSGAYAFSWSIARIAGPALGSIIVERYSFTMLWIVLIATCLACAVFFYRFDRNNSTRVLTPAS
ncbi:MAG: MFS transporter [Bacteroidetes bacterium]|nr:MFS transporter [Bacteroidota bacterium]